MPFDANSLAMRSGSAERFFQCSLYLLLVAGFVALMGTGKLDLPSLALVIPALLVRGYFLLVRREVVLSERWTTYLTLFYFAFYGADYFFLSQSFISATVHMVLFSLVVKLFSVRRDRDLVYLAVISFLMVLAAAVLTVDTMFLAAFSLFILVAMATFIGMEMRRSERAAVVAEVAPQKGGEFYRSLSASALTLGMLTLAGAAVIFLILPRVNSAGYLRTFGAQNAMLTGFSNEVRLGGIGQIQQSSAVVMHVQILSGNMPDNLKWRGIALANFDGHRWWNPVETPTLQSLAGSSVDLVRAMPSAFYSGALPAPRLPTLSYRVVMEPIGLNLFFLAPVPLRLSGDYRFVAVTPDGSVFASVNDGDMGQGVKVYTAQSDVENPDWFMRGSNSRNYPPHIANLYLQLPRVDPRVRELAGSIAAGATSNYARAKAVEDYLKSHFSYTLELPGVREPDPLVAFLFQRKKGHCEYFASSMAVMLRILGIPSRVVNGFRGGEYNTLTGRYIVRERDAHSWVEAYFPEFGWVTFDPTPAGTSINSGSGLSRLELYLDALRGVWREWVINYDFSHQVRLSNELSATTGHAQSTFRVWIWRKYRRLLNRIAGWQTRMQRMSPREMAFYCGLLAMLLALPFAPKAWRSFQKVLARRDPQRAPGSAASFWYSRMLRRLARSGIRKTPAQTPAEFTLSIADPELRRHVEIFTEHYQRARFAGSVDDAQRLPELYEEMAGKR